MWLTCALVASAADTYDFTYNNLQFVITGTNTAKVVGHVASSPVGNFNIYGTATNSAMGIQYRVTEIGEGAFKDCNRITSIYIEDNVVTIGKDAFTGCSAMTSVTLPNTLYIIGNNSFGNCSSLTKVVIPNSVYYVEGMAFYGCSALTSVDLGENCRFNYGGWCLNIFKGCTSLTDITCRSLEAREFREPMFDESTYTTATLHVPSPSVDAYMATNYWYKFTNVQVYADEVMLSSALNIEGGIIHFVSNGDYPWVVVTEGDRTFAQSTNAGQASSSSIMTATVTLNGSMTLFFDFKAWGEGLGEGYDKCEFLVDGVSQFSYGARQNDWETYSMPLTAGTHTLTWQYTKDGVINPTGDYFAVDNVTIRSIEKRGDVDADGDVDISDVSALIDYLLSGDASGILLVDADCDQDGNVTINDVSTLIDYLLSDSWPRNSFTVAGVTFNMVPVVGGTFTMGFTGVSPDSYDASALPAHQVTLSSYSIGETEVTQALWEAVMGDNPSYYVGDMNRPVESVSWDDCQQFITQLNQMMGMNFRLPTEAEWEFAARGGNMNHGYPYAGSSIIDDVSWNDNSLVNTTQPVGQKAPNELGLYDMSGNVWEWCNDYYGAYSADAQTNPTGPESGDKRINRGGAFFNTEVGHRVWFRNQGYANQNAGGLGFRLAL